MLKIKLHKTVFSEIHFCIYIFSYDKREMNQDKSRYINMKNVSLVSAEFTGSMKKVESGKKLRAPS